MNERRGILLAGMAAVVTLAASHAGDISKSDPLIAGFEHPPESARPRVWWHWLSGNVDPRGITLDFEWMKRVGIAGAQMFDGDMGAPQIVPKRVTVLSPEWRANLHFAAAEADRLGLEFGMASAPGWSETGGPWITPEQAMKKVVWSEMRVSGGGQREIRLPPLPTQSGPFQSIVGHEAGGADAHFAKDVAVIAFPAPEGDVALLDLAPELSASTGVDAAALARLHDGDLTQAVSLPVPTPESPVWIRYDFPAPQSMRALTMAGPFGGRFGEGPSGRIDSSDDGRNWRSIRTLVGQAHKPAPQRTFAFPAVRARHFRILFERRDISREPYPQDPGLVLRELALVPGARVDFFEDKAGFGTLADSAAQPTPSYGTAEAINPADIIDLSAKLRADGTLAWKAPRGHWILLRVGYSLTGEENGPATPEGTGLEVDKLDATHVREHLDAYITPIARDLGPLFGARGLRYLLTDSWEAGLQNWTERMPQEFAARRGYSLVKFLPVITGRVVDDARASDAFLWDFRRTIADLVAENHYGTITRYAKEHGLGYYGEATGAAWPTISDGMQAKSFTDIPMGEFWAMPFGGKPAAYHGVRADEFPADIIESRSTAHVYGKSLVAAEAFTSSLPHWKSTPWSLKWVADKYMAMGVNRLVIHTSPHQPGDGNVPGLTLGPFGQAFTRNETWGELAAPWIDYLSRGSFLLQQGEPVTQVLFFYGEGAPSGVPYRASGTPVDLRGYGFDYVNADALLKLARVEDGQICFPGGARYRLLVLPSESRQMTVPLLRKLGELVAAGAVIAGPKPLQSPSLADDGTELGSLADRIWGQTDGRALTLNRFGKGRVHWDPVLENVLDSEAIGRDFDYGAADAAADVRFLHRRTDDGHIYFVTEQAGRATRIDARFAVTGFAPQLWHADTGSREPASYRMADGATTVPISLEPYESVFVVFRERTERAAVTLAEPSRRLMATLDGEWSVTFDAARGAPARVSLQSGSWTESADPGIRYYSGIATYAREIVVPRAQFRPGERQVLDLGSVGAIAEVRINGQVVGTAWKPPYTVDLGTSLRPGANRLEIRVANVWFNRFVGDLQPGATKHAFTNAAAGAGFINIGEAISASSALVPSGLLAPVTLVAVSRAR